MTKTEEIFQLTAPYSNPYQGKAPRILFVCSAGLLRSATAANHFAKKGWNTRSCGSEDFALIPISVNLIAWAEKIFFVNKENYISSEWKFKAHPDALEVLKRKAVVLNISDSFEYGNPTLIKMLEEQVGGIKKGKK